MTFLYALRYFQIVPVLPRLFIVAFAIAVLAGALRLLSDPSAANDALTPVLLLQLFVASSGFKSAARRGYYDLLLTSTTPRWQIALAHCLVSILPGIISWLCVGVVEVAASRGNQFVSIGAGTCTAFIGVSLVAWSVSVFSSRSAAAVGWLLGMTIPRVAQVASPVQLFGVTAGTPGRTTLIAAAAVTLVAFAAAVVSIVRGSAPLEATQ
jgi:hypothetical protein